MKSPNFAGFVGHEGDNVWLEPSQQYEDDAPLVKSWPDLFDVVDQFEPEPWTPKPEPAVEPDLAASSESAPVKRGPGRPRKHPVSEPRAGD